MEHDPIIGRALETGSLKERADDRKANDLPQTARMADLDPRGGRHLRGATEYGVGCKCVPPRQATAEGRREDARGKHSN
jgi:hypothetical protein